MKEKAIVGVLALGALALSGCSYGGDTTVPKSNTEKLTVEDISKKTTPTPPSNSSETQSNNLNASSNTASSMNTPATPTFDPSDRSYVNQYSGAVLHTSKGDIEVKFLSDAAPMAANNFMKLADGHFYDGILFHRVIKGFMIQGGDPNSKESNWALHGTGGPGYKFADELDGKPIARGALAMANAGPNTNGSQFFILTAPSYSGPYTHFGEVVKGMEAVDAIESVSTNANDHPMEDVKILGVDLIKK